MEGSHVHPAFGRDIPGRCEWEDGGSFPAQEGLQWQLTVPSVCRAQHSWTGSNSAGFGVSSPHLGLGQLLSRAELRDVQGQAACGSNPHTHTHTLYIFISLNSENICLHPAPLNCTEVSAALPFFSQLLELCFEQTDPAASPLPTRPEHELFSKHFIKTCEM